MADDQPIIIVKKKGGHGGHHGGAWKVAYADFVTAMMAFFMVMWLLNSSESRVKKAVASYFRKPGIFETGSPYPIDTGAGHGILPDSYQPPRQDEKFDKWQLRRRLPSLSEEIEKLLLEKRRMKGISDIKMETAIKDRLAPLVESPPTKEGLSVRGLAIDQVENKDGVYTKVFNHPDLIPGGSAEIPRGSEEDSKLSETTNEKVEEPAPIILGTPTPEITAEMEKIREQIMTATELKELLGDIEVKIDANGLEIEIMDTERSSMFESGSARIRAEVKPAFAKLAQILGPIAQKLELVGHTDAKPFPTKGYSNWDLSADRANEARRLLNESGLPEDRIASVKGRAATQLRKSDDPNHFSNRRITLRIEFPLPPPAPKLEGTPPSTLIKDPKQKDKGLSVPTPTVAPTPKVLSLEELMEKNGKLDAKDIMESVKRQKDKTLAIPEPAPREEEVDAIAPQQSITPDSFFGRDPVISDADWF